MQEKIVFASKKIVNHAVTNTRDFAIDVRLTHAWSCVVVMIQLEQKRWERSSGLWLWTHGQSWSNLVVVITNVATI
jgi:hypothetical protein